MLSINQVLESVAADRTVIETEQNVSGSGGILTLKWLS